jgi:hypothetical protein
MSWRIAHGLWLATMLLSACAPMTPKPNLFHIEPTKRFTFTPGRDLPKETILHVRLEHLGSEQIFLVNRCGELCNTSKVVAQARGPQDPEDELTYTFTESGEYYFWIQQQLETGESGPVVIEEFTGDARSFTAKFKGGASATGNIALPP